MHKTNILVNSAGKSICYLASQVWSPYFKPQYRGRNVEVRDSWRISILLFEEWKRWKNSLGLPETNQFRSWKAIIGNWKKQIPQWWQGLMSWMDQKFWGNNVKLVMHQISVDKIENPCYWINRCTFDMVLPSILSTQYWESLIFSPCIVIGEIEHFCVPRGQRRFFIKIETKASICSWEVCFCCCTH